MVDEASELFAQHDEGIGEVDLLGSGSPFTDDDAHDHTIDTNLESIFDEQPLPSLNSPLTSPPRSGNSSVQSTDTIPRNNSSASLGLPGNEIVEEDWRDDAFDLRARKDVLLQIVKILHARKQNPTNKWLRDLPYKARKLEEQLYQGASSLEDYRDKRTLKHRLKRVARAIKSKYRASLSRSQPTPKSPTKQPSTQRSTPSASVSSELAVLQALANEQQQSKVAASRRSSLLATELASLQSLVNEQQQKTPARRPSASAISPADLATLQRSLASPGEHQMMQRRHSASIVTPRASNTTSSSIVSELASLRAMNNSIHSRQAQHSPMVARNNTTNAELAALMNGDGHIHPARINGNNRRTSLPSPSNAVDRFQSRPQQQRQATGARRQESIQDQQAANQKLQDQILENIRQQQQLMRELMVGKNQMVSQSSRARPATTSQAPMRLNMANSTAAAAAKPNSTATSALAQSLLLNSGKADQLLSNHHRQLPMDLLQQSLTRGNHVSSNSGSSIMLPRRNSSNYNSSMPPPNRTGNSFMNGQSLQDQLPPNTFNW